MKFINIFRRGVLVTLGVSLLTFATAANAANNTGTGDIAGDAAALQDSNVFSLLSTGSALQLVKRAFLMDGTPITTGATLPTGTTVKFMVYVSNAASITVNDVSMQDVLDPLFSYQANTIKVDNSVANCAGASCTAVEEAAIFAAVNAASAGTDAVDVDALSFTGGNTVDAGNQNQANAQLNAAANSTLAILFNVTMN